MSTGRESARRAQAVSQRMGWVGKRALSKSLDREERRRFLSLVSRAFIQRAVVFSGRLPRASMAA